MMGLEIKVILFFLASTGIVWVSRSSLRNYHSHGFYRFFAWETILVLFLMNVNFWFQDPFSLIHIVSWIFLIISLFLIINGVLLFRREGSIDRQRNDNTLVGIEKTTQLVTSGIYRFIRHPFYSSLLFLGWGIFLKRITLAGILCTVIMTILLTITARKEELENIKFFGENYEEYKKNTKMFIPYVF